jgi:hypothetical protein
MGFTLHYISITFSCCLLKLDVIFKLPDMKAGQCLHFPLKIPCVSFGNSNWLKIFFMFTVQGWTHIMKQFHNLKKFTLIHSHLPKAIFYLNMTFNPLKVIAVFTEFGWLDVTCKYMCLSVSFEKRSVWINPSFNKLLCTHLSAISF